MELSTLYTRQFILECEIAKLKPLAAKAKPNDTSDVSLALYNAYTIQLHNLLKKIEELNPRQKAVGQGSLF